MEDSAALDQSVAVGKEGSVGQRAVDESAADGEPVAGEGAMAADAGAERRASAGLRGGMATRGWDAPGASIFLCVRWA